MAQKDPDVSEKSETAKREEQIAAFWKERDIFQKTLAKKAPNGEFVFYDGPPFANGLPHMGHLLGSSIKDAVGRYKTMRGYYVGRTWGWDCHGLPIETFVEKKLNLKTKKDILAVGVDVFNETARASVMQFEHEWEKYVERLGRFVDFRHSYKTMDNSYIESVWWALKNLHERGLLYEGRKVLMYCPHCETPLAKAEIAMDNTYKDITEEAVTVKFKVRSPEKHGLPENTYLLAWTTTPWTLPGNVALAVNSATRYILLGQRNNNADSEYFIVAKEREILQTKFPEQNWQIIQEKEGSHFLGLEYEPLFDVPALKSEKSYTVYAADFVTTGEGTGIVHTAVMYGEDDFALGQREGLPMVQLLDASAHYNAEAPEFIRGQYIKKAEKAIKEDLEKRGLLFAREMHTHSYPHCYRCGTPLIYNAVASWFINIQKIKARLLEENDKVTWVPEHLKEGRFRHIVEGAPDWTISRNRFWASPLPIWKEKGGSKLMLVGSLEELKQKAKKSGNRYFIMRHGEATHMVSGIYSADREGQFPLTEKGREQIARAVLMVPRGAPVVIVASPVLRTRQSAEVAAQALGIPASEILFDARLAEINFGEFDGKDKTEYQNFIEQPAWYTARPSGGESLEDVKIRFGQALYEYESKYQNSTVLIVTHRIAFEALYAVCEGARGGRIEELVKLVSAGPAALEELPFVPLPVNAKFELDLHRPYIDSIVLLDGDGRQYERIPEVVDCWVESAAMPFASRAEHAHDLSKIKPEELRGKFPYPADFIAEYIAQTRTWFYYMHVMGVALFDSLAFRTVVSTGTILAADGSKMSKSKGNYTDPLALLDRFGADALRLYFMGSVVMQSEDVRFRDDDVREVHNRVIGLLWNSFKFFELYRAELTDGVRSEHSPHPLDRWIRSRMGELIRDMTDAMERYEMPRAARALRLFVDDYSTWYLRRSRERVKSAGSEDGQYALATERAVLLELAKLIAPVAPFIAESIYRGAGGARESVHLEEWPEEMAVDEKLLSDMALARAVVSKALEQRERAGLKVRQPLALLEARELPEDEHIRAIIAEEVNVKRAAHNGVLSEEVWLDTTLTDELRQEGELRDVIRAVQSRRKEAGLSIHDHPPLTLRASAKDALLLRAHSEAICAQTGVSSLTIVEDESAAELSVEFI